MATEVPEYEEKQHAHATYNSHEESVECPFCRRITRIFKGQWCDMGEECMCGALHYPGGFSRKYEDPDERREAHSILYMHGDVVTIWKTPRGRAKWFAYRGNVRITRESSFKKLVLEILIYILYGEEDYLQRSMDCKSGVSDYPDLENGEDYTLEKYRNRR